MVHNRSFTRTLAIIGGIFIIIEGILGILVSLGQISIQNWSFLVEWYYALIAIFIGFLVLLACGIFKKKKKDLPYNGWLLLLLGILGLVLTYWHVGGALVIIASILWILGKY